VLKQIRDLNSGAFGFVVLAKDKETNEQVAIKFLAKGPKITKVFLSSEPWFLVSQIPCNLVVRTHAPADL
jgi:serine/threonine protein kinase